MTIVNIEKSVVMKAQIKMAPSAFILVPFCLSRMYRPNRLGSQMTNKRIPGVVGWQGLCRRATFGGEKLYPDPLRPDEFGLTPDADKRAADSAEYLEQLNRAAEKHRSSSFTPNPSPDGVMATVLSRLKEEEEEKQKRKQAEEERNTTNKTATTRSPVTATAGNYRKAARALWRVGWLTWWAQLILTTVAAVIVLFAVAFPTIDVRTSASAIGFVLVAAAVILALISLVWTYSYTRLSLWLTSDRNSDEIAKSANKRIVSRLRNGLKLALLGLAVATLGLQAIVGTVLARLFSSGLGRQASNSGSGTVPISVLQPVDILVVQASANVVMALLVAVISTTWFRGKAREWDGQANA